MKKLILKAFALTVLAGGVAGCGNSFLETDYYSGVDQETALNSVENISTALNGAYYQLYRYYFAGNYATTIGDIPTDLAYWNAGTQHFDDIYTYSVNDTDTYLYYIWNYGYKVIDNAARLIEGIEALYDESTDEEKAQLDLCKAEAYALRGYAQLVLVNIYAHQIKVNGTDFSSQPGIVLVDKPIKPLEKVSRSTVGQSYQAIVSDLTNALTHFTAAGGDQESLFYFGEAAVHGLLARTYLYMEEWDNAIEHAQDALDAAGITTLTYANNTYRALYNGGTSNTESMFALAINSSQNWSAQSCGTIWSTYDYSPSPWLQTLYADTDCRKSVWALSGAPTSPEFNGGKYAHFSSGNTTYGTCYIVNAPEMFLIIAESNARSTTGTVSDAQSALLTVAKRNSAIASASDLPATKADLLAFIKEERARELFQEGLRLYDLRRWDERASVYANGAPNIAFTYTDYKISDLVYPIPTEEVISGFGVAQNEGWSNTLPGR